MLSICILSIGMAIPFTLLGAAVGMVRLPMVCGWSER